jgi:hypothetical protein
VASVATSWYDSDSNHPAAAVAGSSAGKTPREPVCKGVLVAVVARRVRCPRLFLALEQLHAPAQAGALAGEHGCIGRATCQMCKASPQS